MTDWISAFLGTDLPAWQNYLLLAAGAVVVLLVALWLLRKLTRGTFVSGGRQAQPRISVEDAAPVDSHRRLVLVRRDDVEHLLLIGGASDIVVEHNIRHSSPAQLPSQRELGERPRAASPQPAQPSMAHAVQPARPLPPAMPAAAPLRPVMPAQLPRSVSPADPAAPQRMEPRLDQPAPAAPVVRPEASRFATPVALQRVEPQLPGSRPADPRPVPAAAAMQPDESLDDELEKMLGEFDISAPTKPN